MGDSTIFRAGLRVCLNSTPTEDIYLLSGKHPDKSDQPGTYLKLQASTGKLLWHVNSVVGDASKEFTSTVNVLTAGEWVDLELRYDPADGSGDILLNAESVLDEIAGGNITGLAPVSEIGWGGKSGDFDVSVIHFQKGFEALRYVPAIMSDTPVTDTKLPPTQGDTEDVLEWDSGAWRRSDAGEGVVTKLEVVVDVTESYINSTDYCVGFNRSSVGVHTAFGSARNTRDIVTGAKVVGMYYAHNTGIGRGTYISVQDLDTDKFYAVFHNPHLGGEHEVVFTETQSFGLYKMTGEHIQRAQGGQTAKFHVTFVPRDTMEGV